jgi:hypothetical protein
MKTLKILTAFLILTVLSFTGVVSIAKAKEQDDKGPLTKITFIHYKRDKNQAKPGGGIKPGSITCYGYLAKGAKWKTAENFLVNSTSSNLDQNEVLQSMNAGITEWEKYGGSGIFGDGSLDNNVTYDETTYDGENTVSFGNYSQPDVIAVTNVWGYFGGAPQTRELIEWDMLFNTQFNWGDATTAGNSVMDLQNIATHELGHSAGMNDLYTTSCNLETMYGYSLEGETSKRDLNAGDIKGIQGLYQ